MQVNEVLQPAVFVLSGPHDVISTIAEEIEAGKIDVTLDE
jgi:hypothetical protein